VLSAVRAAARTRPPSSAVAPSLALRSFASYSRTPTSPILRAVLASSRSSSLARPVIAVQCRTLSLGSLFVTKPKTAGTPSPLTIAGIARLEADANAAPHDVPRQLALFEALTATRVRAGYDVIISRWERMCEFVRISGLICVSFHLTSGPMSFF
jgi:ATP-dependent metalloprotease